MRLGVSITKEVSVPERVGRVSGCTVLLVAVGCALSGCAGEPEAEGEATLAGHVPSDFYDAYPGIPSPDGKLTVFADYVAHTRSLSVYDPSTLETHAITDELSDRTRVTWARDNRVIYLDRSPARHGVWSLDPATGEERRVIASADGRLDYPRVRPDGAVTALRTVGGSTAWVRYPPGDSVSAEEVVTDVDGWSAPIQSPDGRRVAYLRAAEDRAELEVLELETGEVSRLLSDLTFAWDRRIEWSSSGDRLYLAAAEPGDTRLVGLSVPTDGTPHSRFAYADRDVLAVTPLDDGRLAVTSQWTSTTVGIAPVAGGEPVAVTLPPGMNAFLPSWRPDGLAIGFVTASWRRLDVPVDFELGMQELDGNRVPVGPAQELLAEEHEDYGAAWSPDGRWLAFHGHLEDSDDIWIVRPRSGDRPTRLTAFGRGADTGEPDWSPDGRSLVFSSHGPPDEGNPSGLYTLHIDPSTGQALGEAIRSDLAGFDGTVMGGRYSPDGQQMSFSGRSLGDGEVTIYTVPVAGGAPTPVIAFTNGEPYGAPEWSDDGKSLFYARNDGAGAFRIWRVDLETGHTAPVTSQGVDALHPALSPDGAYLAYTIRDTSQQITVEYSDSGS